jgi:hypothetical protein
MIVTFFHLEETNKASELSSVERQEQLSTCSSCIVCVHQSAQERSAYPELSLSLCVKGSSDQTAALEGVRWADCRVMLQ